MHLKYDQALYTPSGMRWEFQRVQQQGGTCAGFEHLTGECCRIV